jgi:esterase/lipase superfamily enzyme
MQGIADCLQRKGFTVTNWDYDSRLPIDSIARRLYREIAARPATDTVSFVTHSMGGIIVRALLEISAREAGLPPINRIVMVAPPNRGAELADGFAHNDFVRWLVGPNVDNLTTDSMSYVNRLSLSTPVEVGVIAAAGEKDFGFNPWIKGNNDGYISIEKTKMGTEREFRIVHGVHVFITLDPKVQKMAGNFLMKGRFDN